MNRLDVDTETAALLDRLCAYFDSEIERQENVLALTRAQGEAAKALDADVMEHRTRALALLLDEAASAERERIAILGDLTPRLSQAQQNWSLSALIAAVPEPWQHRLAEAQMNLRATVSATKESVNANAYAMRKSLRSVNGALDQFFGPASGSSYTPQGDAPEGEARQAAVLNATG